VPVAVTSTGGAPLALAGAHSLTTLVTDPRPAFRFAFVLDLGPLPASAAPVFDAASTQLHAVFEPLDVPVPAEAMHDAGGLVVVELGEPRRVHAVRLKSPRTRGGFGAADGKLAAKGARAHGSIRLFRLDGDNVSDKPTATAPLGAGRVATFDDDFTDARFAIGFDEGALELGDLAQVTLRSYPTDPRLAVADAATLAAEPFFFHAAGQLAAATVDAGTQLAQALQQHADGAALDVDHQLPRRNLRQAPHAVERPPRFVVFERGERRTRPAAELVFDESGHDLDVESAVGRDRSGRVERALERTRHDCGD